MGHIKTSHVGIYYRESAKRPFYNGQPDLCFDILYRVKEKIIWEKVGWVSEGYSIQDAIEIRIKRVRTLRHPEQSPVDDPVVSRRPAKGSTKKCRISNDILGKRIKTVHVGVYYRESERRPTYKGKSDRCFDISYRVKKRLSGKKSAGNLKDTLCRMRSIYGRRASGLRATLDLRWQSLFSADTAG